jgi:hemolysin D
MNLNPFTAWQKPYRTLQRRVETELDTAVGLPTTGQWTPRLTQAILLGLAIGVGWSVVARVDVVVNASGKLEPLSKSQVVQSRTDGTVTAVLVKEGQSVKRGQLLIQLGKTSLQNQLQGLLLQRNRLVKEIAVLRLTQQGKPLPTLAKNQREIAPELLHQVQTRLLLVAQFTGNPSQLNAEQRQRYNLFQQQLRDRAALSQLQDENIQVQIGETNAQLSQTQFQLETEQELLDRLQPLVAAGAIPRVTLLQRQVSVNDLRKQIIQNNLQKQQLANNQLLQKVDMGKTYNETLQDVQRQLQELDAKFGSTIKESQQQLVDVNIRLKQVTLDLKQQNLVAPVDGVVFELAAKLPGVVAQSGQALLQVVPNEALTAQVQVANADIANIRPGMAVDVRVDAYPFTEFGAVKGVVSKVSREAVKANDQNPRTVFPVEVRLDRQFLERKSQRFALTPGMSLAAMIKVRQRAPISYVTEEITKAFDGVKSVR